MQNFKGGTGFYFEEEKGGPCGWCAKAKADGLELKLERVMWTPLAREGVRFSQGLYEKPPGNFKQESEGISSLF